MRSHTYPQSPGISTRPSKVWYWPQGRVDFTSQPEPALVYTHNSSLTPRCDRNQRQSLYGKKIPDLQPFHLYRASFYLSTPKFTFLRDTFNCSTRVTRIHNYKTIPTS